MSQGCKENILEYPEYCDLFWPIIEVGQLILVKHDPSDWNFQNQNKFPNKGSLYLWSFRLKNIHKFSFDTLSNNNKIIAVMITDLLAVYQSI